MKRDTYIQKLESTKLTDDNTIGDLKVAKRTEAELKRHWKTAARRHMRTVHGIDEKADCRHWRSWVYEFSLAVRGTVTIKVYQHDERAPAMLSKTYKIKKSDLLT